jgi:hypothetical protein
MKQLREDQVTARVIPYLNKNGWNITHQKTLAEHGVDITAKTSYGRFVYIECKGDCGSLSQKEVSFVYALGQIVTRMSKSKWQQFGLAFPKSFLPKLKRIPWLFAQKNNVFVLLVDYQGRIDKYTWKELKRIQNKKTDLVS